MGVEWGCGVGRGRARGDGGTSDGGFVVLESDEDARPANSIHRPSRSVGSEYRSDAV